MSYNRPGGLPCASWFLEELAASPARWPQAGSVRCKNGNLKRKLP